MSTQLRKSGTVALLICVFSACSLLRVEPKQIIIRNDTGVVLFDLVVYAVDEGTGVRSSASYSGVPPGSEQFIKRRPQRGAMPERVTIAWRIRRNGPLTRRTIEIVDLVKESGSTVLIRLRRDGGVEISVQNLPTR